VCVCVILTEIIERVRSVCAERMKELKSYRSDRLCLVLQIFLT
jgi:hypothetical protein